MKQIVLQSAGKIIYRQVPDPVIKDDEVLVEVKSIGICNSDVAPYLGGLKDIMPLPFVQGHEFGGIIKEIGKKVSSFKIGDKVSVYPQLNCGSCYYCNNGMEHLCENQSMFGSPKKEGAMSELLAVPVANLVKMDDSFNIEYAGLIEPATVAYHAASAYKNINALVIGTGAIGSMIGIVLKHNNCRFIAADINEKSLNAAAELGADLIVNLKDKNRNEIIGNFLKEGLIDLVVLAYISKDNYDFAVDIIRKKGTILVMGTPEKPTAEIELYKPFFKELIFKYSICYSYDEFEKAARLIEKGIIPAEKLVTKIFDFDQASEAFEYKANNFALKVIIRN